MSYTISQIAKILRTSDEWVRNALLDENIVIEDDRPLTKTEFKKIQPLIFRYYQVSRVEKLNDEVSPPKDNCDVEKTVQPQVDDDVPEEMSEYEQIVKKYKIMIDTCSLMHTKCEDVIKALLPALKKYNGKIIVPKKVIDELKKHQKCFDDPSKVELAEKGLYLCNLLLNSGCLSIRGGSNDNFADNVFFVQFTNYRYKYSMLLITQDRKLTHDILQINNLKSAGGFPVNVMRINYNGKLVQSDDMTY